MADKGTTRVVGLTTPPSGTWVQVDRKAMERWARLTMDSPRAAAVMQVMVSRMGRNNALVASQATLAGYSGCSVATLKRALDVLRSQGWLDVKRIGPTGTACAYIVNSRVAWSGPRDGIRYALFDATVLISDAEQPDVAAIGTEAPLEQIPEMYAGESQLPAGEGLDPPAEPEIPGLERDVISKRHP